MATNAFATSCAAVIVSLLATGVAAPPGAGASAGGDGTHPEAMLKELPQGQVRVDALDDELIMHTYKSKGFAGGSGSVTTFIFESDDNLLVFDTQFY